MAKPIHEASRSSLHRDLHAKSRRRRQALAEVAAVSRPQPSLRNDIVPRLELVVLAPATLIIPAGNGRTIIAAHVREVTASISRLGFNDPVLIDGQNNVLDGVVRIEAAKLLGLPGIPCIRASHLTDPERRMLRVALNRLGEKGTWNLDELKPVFEQLILEEMPLEISGFSLPEIDQIVIGEETSVVEVGPVEPDPAANPIAQLGDVFAIGDHRIVCGDSTDPKVLKILMGDDEARLILTDEPYNVPISGHVTGGDHREFLMASGEMSDLEFTAFNVAWIKTCLHHLCNGGLFATFIDWRGYPIVHAVAVQLGLAAINLVCWSKTNAGMGSLYRSQHELLPFFKKGTLPHINNVELGKNGRWRSNVWVYAGASSRGSEARKGLQDHPTVKPVAMLEDALLDVTKRGDIILDPFLGSGSTLIAAEKSGRCCRGVELDARYIDVILRRYELVTGQEAILESSGETASELMMRRRSVVTDQPANT